MATKKLFLKIALYCATLAALSGYFAQSAHADMWGGGGCAAACYAFQQSQNCYSGFNYHSCVVSCLAIKRVVHQRTCDAIWDVCLSGTFPNQTARSYCGTIALACQMTAQ